MKEVILAKTAGFCFGVHRAIDTVYNQVGNNNVYTYGPIIHNEEVVKDLESKGVRVIDDIFDNDLYLGKDSTVIIRSHGVSKKAYDELVGRGVNIVDATCPFVLKIHKIVKEESHNGRQVIVIGNENHPEVEGICGWSETPVIVIDTEEKARKIELKKDKEVCIVSQTTFNYKKFQELVEIISEKGYNISIRNTICNATEERQREAKNIAGEVDTMLVVGGRHSSNTQKLFEICKKECGNTYYIQTPVDLDSEMFQCSSCVGITAGASTPKKIIEEVQEHVRIKF